MNPPTMTAIGATIVPASHTHAIQSKVNIPHTTPHRNASCASIYPKMTRGTIHKSPRGKENIKTNTNTPSHPLGPPCNTIKKYKMINIRNIPIHPSIERIFFIMIFLRNIFTLLKKFHPTNPYSHSHQKRKSNHDREHCVGCI